MIRCYSTGFGDEYRSLPMQPSTEEILTNSMDADQFEAIHRGTIKKWGAFEHVGLKSK
jgi:hypothetical protein